MAHATESGTLTVALIGNPNTGKSTLFGVLSGVSQRVGNYPGVTVEQKLGELEHNGRKWQIVDLPGTYSLAPRSLDEKVAVDVLLGRQPELPLPDVILCVVAANNLQRNLYFVSQLLELGRPLVIALTMNDLAVAEGVKLDTKSIAARLGLPVVPIHARRGEGIEELKQAVEKAAKEGLVTTAPEIFPDAFRHEVAELEAAIGTWLTESPSAGLAQAKPPRYLVERLLLDAGSEENRWFDLDRRHDQALRDRLKAARERLAAAGCRVPEVETVSRFAWVGRLTEGLIDYPEDGHVSLTDRLDSVLTHRLWGSLLLAVVLIVMFSAVFSWAQYPMDWIESAIGWLSAQVESVMPEGTLRSLLLVGVIGGVGSVVIFLPQIVILFFLLTALEECGYMARAAYLMDRVMLRFGLSGRSFIPLLSSFACAIPGIMATRVIENRRDRFTTILIAPLMSCSARLPVYTLMIAAFIPDRSLLGGLLQLQGLTLFGMYLVGVVTAALVAWILKRTVMRSGTPVFVMEMPPYQRPSLRVILARVFERSIDFLQNVGTIIFAVSILMWGALYYPRTGPEQFPDLVASQAQAQQAFDQAKAAGNAAKANEAESALKDIDSKIAGIQQRSSFLGRAGRLIEPLVRPLGWDWRIGSAVISSFPAREVVVATMGVIFDVGAEVEDESGQQRLTAAMQAASWPDTGKPLFTIPVALSIMVFFSLCSQCFSTLAVIARETETWLWALFSFVYMTTLAYVGALLTYQVGTWLGL